MSQRVLYVIACAATPAAEVGTLVGAAQEQGWVTCVLATPSAVRFLDPVALAEQTGYPVRSEYKNPGEPDVLPPPDAIVVAPATVNTINKWAAGICDTLPLGLLVEAIGLRLPVVAVPWTNTAHSAHPAFVDNIGRLRSWGVRVLFERDACDQPGGFGWDAALAAVTDAHAASRRPAV